MKIFYFILLFSTYFSLSGQEIYNGDRHSPHLSGGWMSCTPTLSPNAERGSSHWILYDLNQIYSLGLSHFWNLNSASNYRDGLRSLHIDVSLDGTSWTSLGTIELAEARGSGFYKGEIGLDFDNAQARFILITALENHGGTCYGLSEVRFQVNQAVLPVTLVEQSAHCDIDGSTTMIHWTVENEFNNDFYRVEGSKDADQWEELGILKGDNKAERNNYQFDLHNSMYAYYRISQHDFDGNSTVFDIMNMDCRHSFTGLEVSPTPTADWLHIDFVSQEALPIIVQIVNINGNIVWETNEIHFNQGQRTTVDVSRFPAGLYIVSLKSGNLSFQKKIQKI